ncbi:MAG TPA: type I methionyl aminopeptidase, partial [Geobacteraceae bacterium]
MIILKSLREIEEMRRVNAIVAEILEMIRGKVRPGVSTGELDAVAEEEIRRRGVGAAFLGVKNPQGKPYPARLCTSVNDEIVHGVPSRSRTLREGDLLSVDFGVYNNNFYGDAAFSVAVGQCQDRVHRLIATAEDALAAGIAEARPGNRLGDLSAAVQEVVEGAGYHVVREFVGHGIGTSLHEEPQVPNYGPPGRRERLVPGMCLAIEPMVNVGKPDVRVLDDGWTAVT